MRWPSGDPADLPLEGDEEPRTGDLGWSMALWAVAHAEEYGLTSVSYDGQRWRASDGTDDAEDWAAAGGGDTGGGLVLE